MAIHFSTQNVITACTPFSAIISKYFDFVLNYMFLSFLLCRLGWTDSKWVSSAVFYDGLSKTLAQLSSVLVKLYRLFLFDQWFYYFKHVNSNAGYTLCRWRCQGCMRCVCEGERMFYFRVVYGMKSIQLVRTRKNASFYLIKLSKCKDEGQWDNIDCFYIEFFSFLHNLSALNNFA